MLNFVLGEIYIHITVGVFFEVVRPICLNVSS